MTTAVFAYSRRACETAKRIFQIIPGNCTLYTTQKYLEPGFTPTEKPSSEFYGKVFESCDAMVFVSSCGIAVRHIARHVKDKRFDPAVIVVDELGQHVIPLLSGHIGGANELAKRLAGGIGAVPVITTATDINGRFSVDAWAARNGYLIDNMKIAKDVSAAILERDIPMFCTLPVATGYPEGVFPGDTGGLGIAIGPGTEKPFTETLRLLPVILHLGIGCRKDTPKETIENAVKETFERNGLDLRAVKCAASIDLKAEEQGLLEFCKEYNIPITFYTADELKAVEGDFTPSAFVRQITGVDNVCERSALIGADRLIVRKTAGNGVTVAVATENTEVRFE